MRIVFLDFDGVLNSRALVDAADATGTLAPLGPHLLDAVAVARVERLCVEAEAAIVITSRWRLDFDRAALTAMLRAKGLLTTPILDVTPMIPHKRGRGQEIQRWLDTELPAESHLTGLVILDDEDDMLHLGPWLVQSSFETGLTDEHLVAARRILGAPPPPRAP